MSTRKSILVGVQIAFECKKLPAHTNVVYSVFIWHVGGTGPRDSNFGTESGSPSAVLPDWRRA